MTASNTSRVRMDEIVRWWPLMVVTTLIAVAAGIVSTTQQEPSYAARMRVVVVPLVQWDETFLGTSLVRDSGDTSRTTATVAALLDSRDAAATAAEFLGSGWTAQSVEAAIEVSAGDDTNIIDVEARSIDRARAVGLAAGFVDAVLAERWRTISAEVISRIEALSDPDISDDVVNSDIVSGRLQTLSAIRNSGSDPTVKVESTTPVVRVEQMSVGVVVGLAAAGGLVLGVLAAVGLVHLRRRGDQESGDATTGMGALVGPRGET